MPLRRPPRALAPVVLLLAAALTACGAPRPAGDEPRTSSSPGGSGDPVVVEHAMGTTEVPADPQRVVVLDTGELDAAVSLGVVPVGIVATEVGTGLGGYLSSAAGGRLDDAELVGTIAEPDLEAIAALEPDLVLSNTVRHEDLYDELSAIAPTVFAGGVGVVWKDTLRLVGDALGTPDEADRLIADHEERAASVGAALAGAGGDAAATEVSVVRFLPGEIRLYGEGSFIGTVLADAGLGRPASQQVDDTFVEVSPEQVALADGDVVFSTTYGDPADTDAAAVTGGELWQRLGAVQGGAAHEVSDEVWMLGIGVTAGGLVLDDLERLLG